VFPLAGSNLTPSQSLHARRSPRTVKELGKSLVTEIVNRAARSKPLAYEVQRDSNRSELVIN
jgi:hypothetical protein